MKPRNAKPRRAEPCVLAGELTAQREADRPKERVPLCLRCFTKEDTQMSVRAMLDPRTRNDQRGVATQVAEGKDVVGRPRSLEVR